MNDGELAEILQDELNTFRGILFQNQKFEDGGAEQICYRFDDGGLALLREKFHLSRIAKGGSEFEKAERLTQYFAPRLAHKGNFSEAIDCNAPALLDYALDNPAHGINCVKKSKILQECCLALGIYARRVWLMPYSPYVSDNHVVTEIYDSGMHKWAMLDLTADGYFTDGGGLPLSVSEIREKLANNEACNFVSAAPERSVNSPFPDAETENLYYRRYFAKNLFWLAAEQNNGFGNDGKRLYFLPEHFTADEWIRQNSAMHGREHAGVSETVRASAISALTEPPSKL